MPRKQKIRWPRRPPRLGRLFDNAPPLYFITFNCYKRRHLLAHPEVHEAFRTFCFKAQEHAIAVGRYVIMPEHIHLFCRLSSRRDHPAQLGGIVAERNREAIT
jgi:REP element-mobilizing transposase RayT